MIQIVSLRSVYSTRTRTSPLTVQRIQMHRWDDLTRAWLLDSRLRDALTRLLGAEPYAVQSMLYFKPAGARRQAAKLPDQLPQKEKTRRLEQLIALQNGITVEINQRLAAERRIFEVLVEGRSHKDPEMWQGQTRGGKTVHFAAHRDLTGKFVPVRAIDGHLWGFKAELI